MSIFSKLVGDGGNKRTSRQKKSAEHGYAPGTEIGYDGQLINRFEGHHKSLLKLFNSVSMAAQRHDYDRLAPTLKRFLNVLEQHVLEENLKLYIYLEKCIEDEDHQEMIHEMKVEMGQIGRTVRLFVRHQIQFGINEQNIEKFKQELKTVGSALKDRIQREEDGLYNLYLPPRNYKAI